MIDEKCCLNLEPLFRPLFPKRSPAEPKGFPGKAKGARTFRILGLPPSRKCPIIVSSLDPIGPWCESHSALTFSAMIELNLIMEDNLDPRNFENLANRVFGHAVFPLANKFKEDFWLQEKIPCDFAWTKRTHHLFSFLIPRRICTPGDADCFEFLIKDTNPRLPAHYMSSGGYRKRDLSYSIRFSHDGWQSPFLSVIWGKFISHESELSEIEKLNPIEFDLSVPHQEEAQRIVVEMDARIAKFARAAPVHPPL